MLSADVRNELAAIEPQRDAERLAELSGLFHCAGRVHLLGHGEISLHLDVASAAVARRAFLLLKAFGVASELRTYRQRSFARATRYQLHVAGGPRALQTLHEAGVLTAAGAPLEEVPRRVVAGRATRAAYVRGALLAGGSVSAPPSLHLEIRTASRAGADALTRLVAHEGVELGVAERGDHHVAYARGAEAVAGVLALAGASETVLGLEERAVVAATRSRANRLANADHANLARASRAAWAQVEAVRRLQRAGALDDLAPVLREVAELRVRHPSLSLRELGLKCRPPAPKPSVHRRLRRLVELSRG
jgi:cell division protein WhiA